MALDDSMRIRSRMAARHPDAFWSGVRAAQDHYRAVADGTRPQRPFPPNPYHPTAAGSWDQEIPWLAWNAGWNAGLPERGL